MKRIDVLSEATEAVLAWSPGRQSFRVPRCACIALVLVLMLGALAALAASPAHATTVRGKFQYKDKNLETGTETVRPIAYAKVEIWRFRSRCFLCPWTWAKDATTWTDANGSISLNMPFAGNGVVYGVRVFATNNAAIVYPNDVVHTLPFHREPGEDDGYIMHKTERSATDVLDFSYTFHGWSSQHFNIAEVARLGKAYADARRAPGETDPIPPANFQPTPASIGENSYYNAPVDTVVINDKHKFDDRTILHEYAHYLEEMISSFAPVPTTHYGCDATNWVGTPSNTPDIAWMEGFADYFSQTVQTSLPPGTITDTGYPLTTDYEQADSFCQGLPGSTHPGDGVENFVAGALWDVYDQPSDPGSLNEAHDTLARRDRQIFEIFDRELDVYGVWPTITHFRHAWMGRGLPGVELSRIMLQHHIPQAPREAIVTAGTLREGTVGRLFADDNAYYQVNSTTSGTRRTSWIGSFDVSNNLRDPRIAYEGKNSASCSQTVDVFRWTDSTWVPLSQFSVGTTEVSLANLVPSGAASDYVSGNSGQGELKVRVGCTSNSSSFYSSADLLHITYQLP